jgi:hypothetical protein
MSMRFRFLVGMGVLLNAILILLVVGLIRTTRADLSQIRSEMATRDDIVAAAVPRIDLSQEAKCERCHSERRYAGEKNTRRANILGAVAHMRALPDAGLTDEEMEKVTASLDLLRCTGCHDIDALRSMARESEERRLEIIRRCIARPGSNISPDKANDILRAFHVIVQR